MAKTKKADPIADLEAMHAKMAGLLHVANQQDGRIRDGARAHHDAINQQIAALRATIDRTFPHVAPDVARRYGALLKQRNALQSVLAGDRPDSPFNTARPEAIG